MNNSKANYLKSDKLGRILEGLLWLEIGSAMVPLIIRISWEIRIKSDWWYWDGWPLMGFIFLIGILATAVIFPLWVYKLHNDLNQLFDDYPIKPFKFYQSFLWLSIPYYSLFRVYKLSNTLINHLKSKNREWSHISSSLFLWFTLFCMTWGLINLFGLLGLVNMTPPDMVFFFVSFTGLTYRIPQMLLFLNPFDGTFEICYPISMFLIVTLLKIVKLSRKTVYLLHNSA